MTQTKEGTIFDSQAYEGSAFVLGVPAAAPSCRSVEGQYILTVDQRAMGPKRVKMIDPNFGTQITKR